MYSKYLVLVIFFIIFFVTGCTNNSFRDDSDITLDSNTNTTSTTENRRPTYDEGYSDAPVFLGTVPNEKPAPTNHVCFPGDWSRKAESSFDLWLGMEGTILLPKFNPDVNRYENGKYLDNPSIYFGGNAGAESDVGLTWEIGCEAGDCTQLSTEKFTFRPFWRYIHNSENIWANANDYEPANFYFPGDLLRISVFSPRPNYLQLKIEVIQPTDNIDYVRLRQQYGIDYPADFLSPEFPSVGHGEHDARFMRVNAIDQYYNEGQTSKPTNAVVEEATWKEVYLYRKIGDTVYKVPFIQNRYIAVGCPDPNAFTISYDGVDINKGGEKVSIHPKTSE